MIVLLIAASFLLTACTSVIDLKGGHYAVPRAAEVRSPLGTNIVYSKLEHCSQKSGWWIFADYEDCRDMKAEDLAKFVPASSQGQGGQIASGALIGLGFGLGSAFAGGGASASASSSVIAPAAKGHH